MNIAVIYGGESVEHEVSIISAIQAIENIDRGKYNVINVYLTKKGQFKVDESLTNIDTYKDLQAIDKLASYQFVKTENQVLLEPTIKKMFGNRPTFEIDVFFPIVHGTGVEDGKLQGYLSHFKRPIVGPTVVSGVVGQDKAIMKDLLKAHQINQVEYVWIYDNESIAANVSKILDSLSLPVIIKPANLGSSVGIEVAKTEVELEQAIVSGFTFDQKLVVERLLTDFDEYNISLLGNFRELKCSAIEKPVKNDEFLSYEDKYLSDGGGKKGGKTSSGMASLSREIPANISEELKMQIIELATKAFYVLNTSGVARFDLMVSENEVYINEVNSIPGSLAYYLWEANGYKYQEILTDIIELSIIEFFKEQKLNRTFETNILNVGKLGTKK
ncbi:MAG: hypothetical protein ACRCUP_06175 [Mycoplasmatales bacterium]